MENLDINEFKKLLVIIKDAPNIRIGHFSNSSTEIAKILQEYANEKNYEYLLYATNQEYAKKAQDSIKNVKFFNLKRAKYMLNGKFFDYVFVEDDIKDIESFVKKVHAIIKNAGQIIIFVKSKDYSAIDEWNRCLEENYYVANSQIELGSTMSVIISKKMHGWGG